MKKLGFGFMRMPLLDENDQTKVDVAQVERMADLFFERGFTYCDTAWMYHDFMSEEVVGKAVVDRYPREAFTIATKMPDMMLTSEADVERIYEKQKEKLHVDYFDYYLIHDMNSENYEKAKKYGAIDFCRQKRAEGEIRCLGFSCHDTPEFLDRVLTENPFFEFVQLQINYLDWESAGIQARGCYEVCVKHGKQVIVMEPVKGGTLANPPEIVKQRLREAHPDWSPARWAISFAASLPQVMVVLSGMSTYAQLEENTGFMEDFTPLSEEEMKLLLACAEMIRQTIEIPCTGCRYCVEANECPMGILIPNYFALYNTKKLMKREDFSPEKEYYGNYLGQGYGAASSCIGCQGCEAVCPQHIAITEWLSKVAEELE
ncbi:MAG: aldo/keto reductase [Lachnospiraceae bacterium]|nr:aldo/keto reductase [Lachnospiraceae bacterium]